MIRYLSLAEVLELYRRILEATGGMMGVRDMKGLESALAQPKMSFEGTDLYPSALEKAAALGYSLIMNHPFVDGNKRVGHAAMELFLLLNGYEIDAPVGEQEAELVGVAAGEIERDKLVGWLREKVVPAERK